MVTIKEKKRILKAAREKQIVKYRAISRFFSSILTGQREECEIFKELEGQNKIKNKTISESGMLYPPR